MGEPSPLLCPGLEPLYPPSLRGPPRRHAGGNHAPKPAPAAGSLTEVPPAVQFSAARGTASAYCVLGSGLRGATSVLSNHHSFPQKRSRDQRTREAPPPAELPKRAGAGAGTPTSCPRVVSASSPHPWPSETAGGRSLVHWRATLPQGPPAGGCTWVLGALGTLGGSLKEAQLSWGWKEPLRPVAESWTVPLRQASAGRRVPVPPPTKRCALGPHGKTRGGDGPTVSLQVEHVGTPQTRRLGRLAGPVPGLLQSRASRPDILGGVRSGARWRARPVHLGR